MKKQWEVKKLADLCEAFADGDWIESKDQSSSGIRLVQTGNVGNGFFKDRGEKARYISEDTFKRLRCTEIFEGDCLISRLPDPVGRACILPSTGEKMITAVDCTIVRFNKNILPQFFNYYSQSFQYLYDIERETTGTTRKRISRNKLGDINIPIPPLPQQQRIVSILDKAFTATATAKENALKNLEYAREIFESYLLSIFANTGDGWKKKKLHEVCAQITSSKRVMKADYVKNGIPFYRSKEIIRKSKNLPLENVYYISEKSFLEFKRKYGAPQKGDILISAVGTVGVPYLVEDEQEFYFKDGNLLWLRNIDASVYPKFIIFYFLSDAFKEFLQNLAKGSSQLALTIEKLEEVSIPFPPINEQHTIVARLDALAAETKRLETIYRKKISSLEELKKSILQKAFNGELSGAH